MDADVAAAVRRVSLVNESVTMLAMALYEPHDDTRSLQLGVTGCKGSSIVDVFCSPSTWTRNVVDVTSADDSRSVAWMAVWRSSAHVHVVLHMALRWSLVLVLYDGRIRVAALKHT